MANNQAFKIKNGLSAKRYLQNSTAVSASDVDLSTGSYFTKTLSANTTFTFSNPPASGKAMGFALEVTGANVTVGYDLANASYNSETFSFATQENSCMGLAFKTDGTKMYMCGTTGDDVNEYNLSTAWDVTTASYVQNFSVSAQDTSPLEVFFKPDGTRMFVLGDSGNDINEYDLSTAWDISTASYNSQTFSVGSQDTTPYSFTFKPDGTKMYVVGEINDRVFQYSLSTAWDTSTASYDNVSFSVTSQETSPTGVEFNTDGTKMFVSGFASDKVHEYSLSTAWDISTASYTNQNFSITPASVSTGIRFNNDGTRMYAINNPANVYQYTTSASSPATVAWPSSVKWSGATAPDAPASGEKDVYVFVTTDGGTTYYGKQAGDAVA